MGDFQSMVEQAIRFYLAIAAFWVLVAYSICRLFGWHPISAIAAWVHL